MSALVHWAYVGAYIAWFNWVSHSIITLDALGRPPRPSNHDILEAKDDHTQDLSSACQRIMDIAKSGIEV